MECKALNRTDWRGSDGIEVEPKAGDRIVPHRTGWNAMKRTALKCNEQDRLDFNYTQRRFQMAKNKKIELMDKDIRIGRDYRAIRAELDRIKTSNGEGLLKADDVVENAADKNCPLHGYFEWDDSVAGHKYRLSQARALIRQIEVVMPDDESETFVPKYISLRDDRSKAGGGYRATGDVLKSTKFLTELEETAKKDIDALLRRYEMLKELCAKVRKAIAK